MTARAPLPAVTTPEDLAAHLGVSERTLHGIDEGRRQERAARNAARQARRERIARMKAGVE